MFQWIGNMWSKSLAQVVRRDKGTHRERHKYDKMSTEVEEVIVIYIYSITKQFPDLQLVYFFMRLTV